MWCEFFLRKILPNIVVSIRSDIITLMYITLKIGIDCYW